jgi:hypothetical protein
MFRLKNCIWIALVLCAPLMSWADSVADFQNTGGTMSAINLGTGLSLTGSRLRVISGVPGYNDSGFNIGSVTMTTPALMTGDLEHGATFGAGGTFNILANNGLVFNGTFTSGTWTVIQLPSGKFSFTFAGVVVGTVNGHQVEGVTVQLTTISMTGQNPFGPGGSGQIKLASGDTTGNIAITPETDTLSLTGLGLLGVALLNRRRMFGGGKFLAS